MIVVRRWLQNTAFQRDVCGVRLCVYLDGRLWVGRQASTRRISGKVDDFEPLHSGGMTHIAWQYRVGERQHTDINNPSIRAACTITARARCWCWTRHDQHTRRMRQLCCLLRLWCMVAHQCVLFVGARSGGVRRGQPSTQRPGTD